MEQGWQHKEYMHIIFISAVFKKKTYKKNAMCRVHDLGKIEGNL